MEPYNPDAKCPKCGCTGIKNKFHAKGSWKSIPTMYDTKNGVWTAYTQIPVIQDYITRECFNCGYTWEEAPLDAENYNPGGSVDATPYEIIKVDNKGNILSRNTKDDTT